MAAGTDSVESIRTNEWALRFQMAGKDEDVQAAEVHQAHDSMVDVLADKTSGIANSRLMQSDRAHAVLFSSWINAGPRVLGGVKQAIEKFHDDEVAAADAKTKPDWEKFPWPAADPRWGAMFDAASDDYFVAVISAYDVNLRDPKHAELLWNTRISCPRTSARPLRAGSPPVAAR